MNVLKPKILLLVSLDRFQLKWKTFLRQLLMWSQTQFIFDVIEVNLFFLSPSTFTLFLQMFLATT